MAGEQCVRERGWVLFVCILPGLMPLDRNSNYAYPGFFFRIRITVNCLAIFNLQLEIEK